MATSKIGDARCRQPAAAAASSDEFHQELSTTAREV